MYIHASMHACMYVCMHVCMYLGIYTLYTCIVYIYIHTHLPAHIPWPRSEPPRNPRNPMCEAGFGWMDFNSHNSRGSLVSPNSSTPRSSSITGWFGTSILCLPYEKGKIIPTDEVPNFSEGSAQPSTSLIGENSSVSIPVNPGLARPERLSAETSNGHSVLWSLLPIMG